MKICIKWTLIVRQSRSLCYYWVSDSIMRGYPNSYSVQTFRVGGEEGRRNFFWKVYFDADDAEMRVIWLNINISSQPRGHCVRLGEDLRTSLLLSPTKVQGSRGPLTGNRYHCEIYIEKFWNKASMLQTAKTAINAKSTSSLLVPMHFSTNWLLQRCRERTERNFSNASFKERKIRNSDGKVIFHFYNG